MQQVRNNLWQQSSSSSTNNNDPTKIECTAQKNEIPVRASGRRMHKEMLNIGKRAQQQREASGGNPRKSHAASATKDKCGSQAQSATTCTQHTRTHTQTDRQTIGNREAVENVAGTAGEKMQLGDSMGTAEHAAR